MGNYDSHRPVAEAFQTFLYHIIPPHEKISIEFIIFYNSITLSCNTVKVELATG